MRSSALAAVIALLLASAAGAEDLSARAQLAFQHYGYGKTSTSGFRQTYDLRLDRALTTTSLVRLFFRGDDFRGSIDSPLMAQKTGTRQLQPIGEFILNTGTILAQARVDYFDIRSHTGAIDSNRTLERSMGQLIWQPESLPVLRIMGQRNATHDNAAGVALSDDNGLASLSYDWRSLRAVAEERYTRSTDPRAGFDRTTLTHQADLAYVNSYRNGKLTVGAEGFAQLMDIDERSVDQRPSSVPTPVSIGRALYGIDETPADSRDHPLASNPALIDGDLNASTGITIGPAGASFQNIALDLARVDRADEIRIIVRDPSGNPLRNGGGAVTWDLYTSEDGQLWTPVTTAQTTFSAPLSLYSVTFDLTVARWFKVVNFGVNVEETLVTEVQAYYHTTIPGGGQRKGTQNLYTATSSIAWHPVERLTFAHTGVYNSVRQELSTLPLTTTTNLEHVGSVQYDIARALAVRGEYLKRDVKTFTGTREEADGLTMFLDYSPTRRLKTTLELGRQRQTLDARPFTIDTRAIHASAFILKSVSLTADAGTQTQTIAADSSTARRTFVNLASNLQLLPSVRLFLTGSLQRTSTESTDPAVQILGPTRDDRAGADFVWRPGQPLAVGVRLGWVAGQALSGFTQRYHVEWYPFADGTLSLGGAYDQDIDPALNRRATRTLFNPRWIMNRHASFDLNYTSVSTTFASLTQRQRTVFATMTLTK